MSVQSDAAKKHIENLLNEAYPRKYVVVFGESPQQWFPEYRFADSRKWRFDYAVPSIRCANTEGFAISSFSLCGVIELDGGTFQQVRTGHASGVGLRAWREKNNAAMSAGWRVWHYAPEEVIKAGRKVLIRLEFVCRVGLIPNGMDFIIRSILGNGEGIRNPA